MPKAEFIQSAAQVAGQAKELFDAGARTNLLQSLVEQGHPYGLLLENAQASGLPIFCLEVSLLSSSGSDASSREKGPKSSPETLNNFLTILVALPILVGKWSLKFAPTQFSSEHSESFTDSSSERGGMSKSASSYENKYLHTLLSLGKDRDIRLAIFKFLKTGSLSGKTWNFSNQEGFFENAAIIPIFLNFLVEKTLPERSRELTVGKHSVSLGTTAIKLATYQGEQPFVVRTPQCEPIAQINPGDQLGHLHVSRQASVMRCLSPLQRAEQITNDFIDLFKAVDNGAPNLDAKQQAILIQAQNATLIGISHLVRLFRHRTGLPTWKLDVLPELVQKFHQHDSQAVSTAFGGTRKVRVSDVEMMVVTPAMRQALVAQSL